MIRGLLNKTNMENAKIMPTPMADQGLSKKTDQPQEKLKNIEIDIEDKERKEKKRKELSKK